MRSAGGQPRRNLARSPSPESGSFFLISPAPGLACQILLTYRASVIGEKHRSGKIRRARRKRPLRCMGPCPPVLERSAPVNAWEAVYSFGKRKRPPGRAAPSKGRWSGGCPPLAQRDQIHVAFLASQICHRFCHIAAQKARYRVNPDLPAWWEMRLPAVDSSHRATRNRQ